jgi:glutamine synthetase type III
MRENAQSPVLNAHGSVEKQLSAEASIRTVDAYSDVEGLRFSAAKACATWRLSAVVLFPRFH